MMDASKYTRAYFMPPVPSVKWTQKEYIDKAPRWCSVDLRDGNQALIIPMNLQEKLEFFKLLVKIGFKEIEVGFPAASETEFTFLRTLIEQDLIPEDVTIQVLTQAREHIIRRTFDALKDCKNKTIVHVYNSTSAAQRESVFKKNREEIIQIAVEGAKLLKQLTEEAGASYQFEYSPESFTGTEMDYALDVCNAVIDVWQPRPDWKVIINLPATVSHSLPHIYASQIEYMCDHLKNRENLIISLHPHNDRGTGVADTELALLAGADRVEGTLFGNGERTGNVDIVTLALNMYVQGVDPGLDFSNMNEIADTYERLTRMVIPDRQPYAGKLVFAAFSGSHQDAIAKAMHWKEKQGTNRWNVPYLPLDPKDIGREYEADVIRINSQSGKGGIGYILEQKYGYVLPAKMREELGYRIKSVSDQLQKELQPDEIRDIFEEKYLDISSPIELVQAHFIQLQSGISTELILVRDGIDKVYHGRGNGRLDAVSNSLKRHCHINFSIYEYAEHALKRGSDSQACSYVGIEAEDGLIYWGAGIHNDIIDSSVKALISAINKLILVDREKKESEYYYE